MFNEAQSSLFKFNMSERTNEFTGESDSLGMLFKNKRQFEDLSNVQVLHMGIDTYKGKFKGTINTDFGRRILLSLESGEYDPIFQVAGHDFLLSPASLASRYRFCLKSPSLGFIIFFGDPFIKDDGWLSNDKGKIKYEVSPHFIYDNGMEGVDLMISAFNQEIMFYFLPTACDVHMCVDIQGWKPPSDLIEHMVTMTRRKVNYNGIDEFDFDLTSSAVRYGSNDSFTFGRANSSQLGIYNKAKEAQYKGTTTFWRSVWGLNNVAYKPKEDVFRIELRLPAIVLRNLVKRDDGTVCSIIDIQSLDKQLNTLWVYGLSRLFRYDYDTSKTKKKTIKPIWQFLLDDIYFNDFFQVADYKREYISTDDSFDANLGIMLGNLTTLMAKSGKTEEQLISMLQSMPIYRQLLEYALDKKQLNEEHYIAHLVNIYRKKRIKYDKKASSSVLDFQKYRRNYSTFRSESFAVYEAGQTH